MNNQEITIQTESFMERLEELQVLLPLHYEELALDKEHVPLDPMYEVYEKYEKDNNLLFVTIRKGGELIGYFIGFIAPGLHYRTCLTCTMDIFYLHPDHRGSSLGYKLFESVEKELKEREVDRWFVGSKLHKDCGHLFKKLDFRPIETYYSKYLGE